MNSSEGTATPSQYRLMKFLLICYTAIHSLRPGVLLSLQVLYTKATPMAKTWEAKSGSLQPRTGIYEKHILEPDSSMNQTLGVGLTKPQAPQRAPRATYSIHMVQFPWLLLLLLYYSRGSAQEFITLGSASPKIESNESIHSTPKSGSG